MHWVPALASWNKSFPSSKCSLLRQTSQSIFVVLGLFFLKYKKPPERNAKQSPVYATVGSDMESGLPALATSLASSQSACCQSVVSGSCFGVGPGEPSEVQCYSHTVLLWALWSGILSVESLELFRRTSCHSPECSSIHTTPTDWRTWSKLSSESSFLLTSQIMCHFSKARIGQKSPINIAVLRHPFIGCVPLCPPRKLNLAKKEARHIWQGSLYHLTPAEGNWSWGNYHIMSVWPQQGVEN